MRFSTIVSAIPLLSGLALAETPATFVPDVKDHLSVNFGSGDITPGVTLTKSATAKQPAIGTTDELKGTYLLFFVDNDSSFGGSANGPRGQVLHGLLPGYKSSGSKSNGTYVLTSSTAAITAWMGPAPPAETPAHPHNYVALIFEQPDNFAVPASQKQATSSRIGFNLTQFIAAAGLKAPLKANYWQVPSGST